MNKNMIAVNFEEKFVKEEDKKLEKLKDKNWISEVVSKEKVNRKIFKKSLFEKFRFILISSKISLN